MLIENNLIVNYFIIYSSLDSANSDTYPGYRLKYKRKLCRRCFDRSCLKFIFTVKHALQLSCCDEDKNRLRKRGWAIRDRLVVPFGEEGRDEEINIQRETRCPGR